MKAKFGTVEKHGNKYRATAMINGERLRNSFHSEPEANRWIEELQKQILLHSADSVFKSESLAVANLFEHYAEDPNHPRPEEQRSKFNSLLYTLNKLGLAETPISRFKTRDVLALRDARHKGGITPSGKKLKPQTINKDLTFISGAFTHAVLVLDIENVSDPVIKGVRVKNNQDPVCEIPKDDLEKIRASAAKYESHSLAKTPLADMITIVLETTCRLGEVCSLRWENLAPDGQTIYLGVSDDKNKKGRDLYLTKKAQEIISARGPKSSGLIFDVKKDTLRQAWARSVERAGVKHYTFHQTRHSACSELARFGPLVGMSEPMMRKISGHRTPSSFARYVHADRDELISQWNRMSEIRK